MSSSSIPGAARKKAIAIARVSSDEQAGEDRTSLASQLADIGVWCERYGYEVVDEIREEGVSVTGAFDPAVNPRPFWRAYARLKAREVDAIVFWRPSRLSRDPNAMRVGMVIQESRQYGTGIVFAEGPPPRADDDMGQVSAFLQAWASSVDAKNRRDSMVRGIKAKWERREWGNGHTPFGYVWDREARRLVVDPPTAEMVRLVFNEYIASGLGMTRLAAALNERGLRPPSEAKGWTRGQAAGWTSAQVSRLLKREFYATGRYVRTFGGEGFLFEVEPILDAETFAKATALREGRPHIEELADGTWRRHLGTNGEGRTGDRSLLQGRVYCGACGQRWTLDRKHAAVERGLRYFCRNRLASRKPGTPKCAMTSVPVNELDDLVWAAVRDALQDSTSLREAGENYLRRLEARITAANPEVTRQDRELQELRDLRERTIDAELRYRVDRRADVERLDGRIAALETALSLHAEERAQLGNLRDERERMERAVALFGGAAHLFEDDEDPANPNVRVAYRQGRKRTGRFLKASEAFSATETMTRNQIVDLLRVRVTLNEGGEVVVEGVVDAHLSLPSLA